MTLTEFRQLVADGKAAEVDRVMGDYQHTQSEDPTDQSRLDGAFYRMGLTEFTPETRRAVDAWKKQRPQSAFAVAASGFQYHSAAWVARGEDAASDTPEEKWVAMRKLAALARAELDRAANMQPTIPLVSADRFSLGILTGDETYAEEALASGRIASPGAMSPRLIQSSMSGSNWGAGAPALLSQANDAAAIANRFPLLWVVVGRARMKAATDPSIRNRAKTDFLAAAVEVATAVDLGALANRAYRDGEFSQALILAVEAWRFDDGEPNALYVIGFASQHARYEDWARTTLKNAARNHPDAIEVARNAGVALLALKESAEAERLLSYAIQRNPDDVWTLTQLGFLYLNSAHRYDRAKTIASSLIRLDDDNPDGYALRTFAQIETDDPERYTSIHAFLDRFEQRDGEQYASDSMRQYLGEHPEPLKR
ncbi:Flp pilus assembly protein TadD [Luteibacter sp. OK325]|nr:Flp pilus assembly protein TadD [Luteibacter sp. OK325]